MLALLLVGGVVYLVLGDLKEAIILLAFATMSIVDHRGAGDAHRARAGGAARPHQPPRAGHSRRRAQAHRRPRGRARRSHRPLRRRPRAGRRHASAVRGSAGRRIPADRRIRAGAQGRAGTIAEVPAPQRPGGDDLPHVFSGSLVVRGTGLAEVTAPAREARSARSASRCATLETEPPRLQAQTRRARPAVCASSAAAVSVLAVAALRLSCAADGWMRCSPALRSACRCCRRSFRSS